MPNTARAAFALREVSPLAFLACALLSSALAQGPQSLAAAPRPPNIVLVVADDLGLGDLGCGGAAAGATPRLDRLAAEGIRCSDFYVPQAICTASRAALLTGLYPQRIGMIGALAPGDAFGLDARETTIAEVLQQRGYATGLVGKWHLGHHPCFHPMRHGFDEYFGLPYSNDMSGDGEPPLPLMHGDRVVELDPDQDQLTARYTERALAMIERWKDRPFFLLLAHSMPHVPLHVSPEFRGKTGRGLYADVVAELDASTGRILDRLESLQLSNDTLVLVLSDNGPWRLYGDHAGSTAGLRGGKSSAFEGGVRVPLLARWPAHLPAGRIVSEPTASIDLLPTLARLAGAPLPSTCRLDGRDVWDVWSGAAAALEPPRALYFYWGYELHALRAGPWKLHFPHAYRAVTEAGSGGALGSEASERIGLALFDVVADPGEAHDVLAEHADVVARLQVFAEEARSDLGDALLNRRSKNLRGPGRAKRRR